jgi:hypothetical protein
MEDDIDTWTWQWHPSAGKVYRYEPTVHQQWQGLFSMEGTNANEGYQPFTSRLDWEVAQWAVKEKIPQRSFNRLLRIPQVRVKQLNPSFLILMLLWNCLGEGAFGSFILECAIYAATSRSDT